jgi:hypothetical protein
MGGVDLDMTTGDPSPSAFRSPELLLPRAGIDLQRWAVIACDQFTSDRSYWSKVESTVGDAPSTYHMILPEAFLRTPMEQERIQNARVAMRDFLEQRLLGEPRGPVYV